MTKMKREIEAKGATVDEAVAAGVAKLGVDESDVTVTVLDEGSRGLLGLGARDAVVRLTAMVDAPQKAKPAPKPEPKPKQAPKAEPEPQPEPVKAEAPAPPAPKQEEAASEPTPAVVEEEVSLAELDETLQEDGATAVAIVTEMLDKMGMDVTVSSKVSDPDEMSGRRMPIVEITGNDLGVLIGPQGETLNALQYLTRLMVGHKLHRRAEFMVDVQGYRDRREQALTRLAERMAQKAVKRNRSVSLEPMSPYERRIIHMALRNHEKVRTNSVGEGNRRRVRIIPK